MPPIRFRNVALVILLVWSSSCCLAQWLDDPAAEAHIRSGIGHVYNLSFDSARTEFQQVAHLKPDHPAGYFFLAMIEWWRIMINIDDKSHDEKFIAMLDKVIDVCDKRLDKNDNDLAALFFKGGSLGYQGRLYANRDDWMKAASAGQQALPIVQKCYKIAPENYDILLGIGIYNYYAAVIPEQYPIVKPLMIFFPSGDKEKGIRQLKHASEKAVYANIEASYFLLQLMYNYEHRYDEAMPVALKLQTMFPNNVIFQRYVGRVYAGVGRWNEMKETFDEVIDRVQAKKTGYGNAAEREARYYLGLYEMNAEKYDAALQHFYRCDELSRTLDVDKPSGFMVMTNLKIGNIYDVQAKRDIAIVQYKKVLEMNEYQDSHKKAEEFLKSPYSKF